MSNSNIVITKARELADMAAMMPDEIARVIESQISCNSLASTFIFSLNIFILACFVGYYVILKVTPALHTPLMSVTNAISGIVILGAMIACGSERLGVSNLLGFLGVVIASVNIFGGFIVTTRMLNMFDRSKNE